MAGRRCFSRAFAVLSTAALAVLVGPPGMASADGLPQANPDQRAAAIIRPSIMYLTGQGSGLVRLPNGQILSQFGQGSSMPFLAVWGCTAFAVNPDGWVATAGHCVDPDSAKALILKRAANEYITEFPDAPGAGDAATAFEWLQKNARVEGDAPEHRPQVSLALMYGTGNNVAGKVAATVVDFRPLGKGDVALLHVDKHNLPSSELATDADVSIGTSILAVGFPESTRKITGPSMDPTNKSGKVSKKSALESNPVYEIDAAVTEGMSGGPCVALNGKVIGVNSFAPIGEPQPFNFITPADTVAELLASKGIKPRLGAADVSYRKGLDQYYSGHYTEAIGDFDLTSAMSPDYPGVVELKASAANLRQQYGDLSTFRGAKLLWYIAGGIVLVLAVAAGLTLMVLRSGRPDEPPKASGLQLVPAVPAAEATPEPHYCSGCGAQHHHAEKFCPNCGKQIVPGALGANRIS